MSRLQIIRDLVTRRVSIDDREESQGNPYTMIDLRSSHSRSSNTYIHGYRINIIIGAADALRDVARTEVLTETLPIFLSLRE